MGILIRFFTLLLAVIVYEDTLNINERDNYLIIKPHYDPLIPLFAARAVASFVVIIIILEVVPRLLTHQQLDDGFVALICVILLSLICLWRMFASTRIMLKRAIIPKTVFDRPQGHIRIAKHQPILFRDVYGIQLENIAIFAENTTISIQLLTDYGSTEILICNVECLETLDNAKNLTQSMLSFIIRRSENMSDYLIQVDWHRLQYNKRHSEYIEIRR